MSEDQHRTNDLAQLARDLHESRQILTNVESVALAGVAQMLADTTETLMAVTGELRTRMPDNWLDTEPAAKHLGLSRSGLENTDCPRHYLTPKKPKWYIPELDEWGLSK